MASVSMTFYLNEVIKPDSESIRAESGDPADFKFIVSDNRFKTISETTSSLPSRQPKP
jgi:hypothetical protein